MKDIKFEIKYQENPGWTLKCPRCESNDGDFVLVYDKNEPFAPRIIVEMGECFTCGYRYSKNG